MVVRFVHAASVTIVVRLLVGFRVKVINLVQS